MFYFVAWSCPSSMSITVVNPSKVLNGLQVWHCLYWWAPGVNVCKCVSGPYQWIQYVVCLLNRLFLAFQLLEFKQVFHCIFSIKNITLIFSSNSSLSLQTKTVFCWPLLNLHLLYISGEKGTLTHGSVVNGRFEGFIKTHQGTYYVEPSERYLQDKNVPFHSVIYHEEDIGK